MSDSSDPISRLNAGLEGRCRVGSIYIVAGVPASFKKELQKLVASEAKSDSDVMLLEERMTDWVLAYVKGEKRRRHERTEGSSALWRAYVQLSAALYHLQDQPTETKIRNIRDRIEELWREASPLGDEAEELEEVD